MGYRAEEIVHVCFACGAVLVEGAWTLSATIPEGKPQSHGYCDDCFRTRMAALGVLPERIDAILHLKEKELAADGR